MASSGAQVELNPFADSSLFRLFDDEGNTNNKIEQTESQEPDNNRLLADLKKENEELRRRLRLLEPPSEGQFTSAEDSPVLQVIFMHHDNISKKRQVIEDFVQQLVSDSIEQKESSAYDQLLPQRSALRIRGSNVTFLATGSVQYYNQFCLDILGRPLVDGDIALTEDWTIPTFERGFPDVLPAEEGGQKKGRKARPKPSCFNCGQEGHALRECPAERNFSRINAAKKEFMSQQTSSPGLNNKRYHKDTDSDQKYATFKPGVVSDELRKAMGLSDQALPAYIYTMRMLGYPPGYLKEAEITTSGLAVYDTLKDEDGEIKEVHDKPLKYNVTKLVKYPGFNIPPPEGVADNHQSYNLPPMQPYHNYDSFYTFMSSGGQQPEGVVKRKGDFNESEDGSRHKRSRVQEVKDMEIGSPRSPGSPSSDGGAGRGSPFRPPLPPTPGATELPPLPLSTPPATPVRTPRDTPQGSVESTPVPSPSVCSTDGIYPDRTDSQDSEDSASLDELVGQQRALLSKLNDAMDSETAPESDVIVISSTDKESGEGEDSSAVEGGMDVTTEVEAMSEFVTLDETFEDSATQDSSSKVATLEGVGEGSAENGEDGTVEREPMEEVPNKSGVPHRINFATGITPHVDENVAASKGVFQKILGLFKVTKDQKSS